MRKNKRLEYNRAIVKILTELVEKMPEHRFAQLIYQLEIGEPVHLSDRHAEISPHTESKTTLERLLSSSLVDHAQSARALRVLFLEERDGDT